MSGGSLVNTGYAYEYGKLKSQELKRKEKLKKEFRDKLRAQRSKSPVQQCPNDAKKCCDQAWDRVKAETDLIKNHPDVVERNRQINAAYADLYLKDPKTQKWAGTAAIVSKQVGCTMTNNVAASNAALGKGNKAIFENIYPTIKMYDVAGKKLTKQQFMACMDRKIGKQNLAPLKKAVDKMYEGKGHEAAIDIATHEQKVIVQNAMWNSRWMKIQAGTNRIVGGAFADQSVYFTSNCEKPGDKELKFPGKLKIWKADDRVKFYKDEFLPYFDKFNKTPANINNIMKGIRSNGGTF